MAYIVVFLWVIMGIFVCVYQPKDLKGIIIPKVTLTSLSLYFVSLTGFVGSFIYGDTVKTKDWTTPIFMKGPNDSRETIIYACLLLWLISGVVAIIFNIGLDQVSAYFAALTPFVAGYVLGETQRSSNPAQKSIASVDGDDLNQNSK